MSIDDVQDKTRRNLVAYSAGIIAVRVLDVPFTGQLFGSIPVGELNPTIAWVLAFVILAYLWLRFRYAPPNEKGMLEEIEERGKVGITRLNDDVVKEFLRFANQERPRGVKFVESPLPASQPIADLRRATVFWDGSTRGRLRLDWSNATRPAEEGQEDATKSTELPFQLKTITVAKSALLDFLRKYKLSWPMLEYRIPNILSNIAAVICIWEILGFIPK